LRRPFTGALLHIVQIFVAGCRRDRFVDMIS
jgi:hypothetical protein